MIAEIHSVEVVYVDLMEVNTYGMQKTSLDTIFERAAKEYDIPVNLLKAIAKAESEFNPKAKSKSGAMGVMQLMPGTARGLGVIDAYNAEQNIMGGAKYFKGLLVKYKGNIELSLAAYNAGPGNVDKYGGIPPFKETKSYVPKVMGYYNGGNILTPSEVQIEKEVVPLIVVPEFVEGTTIKTETMDEVLKLLRSIEGYQNINSTSDLENQVSNGKIDSNAINMILSLHKYQSNMTINSVVNSYKK